MKVLITGALGWLGKALTEVVGRNHPVRAFDLETVEVIRESLDFNGEVMFGSVADFEIVQAAVKGQQAIIHAAMMSTARGLYSPGDPVPFDINVRGTYNLLEAARQEGIRRFILISAAETHVDHPPNTFIDRTTPYAGRGTIYDLTKRLQEEICHWFAQLYAFDIIVLRLGDVLDLERGTTKKGDKLWHYSLDNDSWLDRYDVGRACLQALELEHTGFDVFHLIGAPSAKKRFDVARAEAALSLRFTTEFDRRPASERS